MEPSGSDKGFFQEAPTLSNQFYDESFQRCYHLFLPTDIASANKVEVSTLGQEVISSQIFAWITDSERNTPYLKGSGRNAFGSWIGDLVTGEGWRELQKFGQAKGFIATGYDTPYGRYARSLQFLRLQLWEPSCANVTCPSAMQDGAARLLQMQLGNGEQSTLPDDQRKVFELAYQHLTSRDPAVAWTSGQWMTERTGGSDVSLTETLATRVASNPSVRGEGNMPLGPWSLSGFKWFSSATDCNMTVALARTPQGKLSAFLAPMRRIPESAGINGAAESELNGIRIQRLKNKVGTKPLPTAELILDDMRAWMIGEEGRGIQAISTVLNITRIHSAVAAVGYSSRGLAIARAFAEVREIGVGRGGRIKLSQSPLHMRQLARLTAEHRGHMLLTFLTAHVLGTTEHRDQGKFTVSPALAALSPDPRHAAALLRVLTQITKAYVCKLSVPLVFSCMEALGGVGYLENIEQEYLNISRLWRDCGVLPIWEGTTDVLSTDFIRASKHPKDGSASLDALESFVMAASAYQGHGQGVSGWDPLCKWQSIRQRIDGTSQNELMGDARDILWDVAQLLIAVLLQVDARSDGNRVSCDIFERFVREHQLRAQPVRGASTFERDFAIVFGRPKPSTPAKL